MKTTALIAFVSLASSTWAFPLMLRELGVDNLEQFEAKVKRASVVQQPYLQSKQKRQSGTTFPSIPLPVLTVPGLAFPSSIQLPGQPTVGTKVIPDSSHSFQAPGSSDQRGGCPGLNIMANYGYMSHTGVVGAGELIYAMQEMLGYANDLGQVLIALAIRAGNMDPTTLKMSIGAKDSRTDGPLSGVLGSASGLFDYNIHNKYEIDGSMAYDDSYFHRSVNSNAGGHFNGTRFAKMQATADATSGGLYDANFHIQHRLDSYNECIATNPTCTWNVIGELLFYGADTYTYLGMASTNEDTNQIREPDSASIQSFFGAQANSDGTFTNVPEKLHPGPDGNWYRRATPLTTAEIAEQIATIYGGHPVLFGANNGNAVNTFTPSATQFSGDGTGAMCLILSQAVENDGAFGARFGIAADAVAKMIAALIAPAASALSCGGLQN